MRQTLPEAVLNEIGRLDPAAIAEVREEAWPDVRDADELHDVLHTLIALPAKLAALGKPTPNKLGDFIFPSWCYIRAPPAHEWRRRILGRHRTCAYIQGALSGCRVRACHQRD